MVILKENFICELSHVYAVIKMTWKNPYWEKHGFSPESKTKKDSITKLLRFAIGRRKTVIPPYLKLQLKIFLARYNEYYLKPYRIEIKDNMVTVYKKGKLITLLYIDDSEIVQMPQIDPF